jgi:hypothetical protein
MRINIWIVLAVLLALFAITRYLQHQADETFRSLGAAGQAKMAGVSMAEAGTGLAKAPIPAD